MEYSRKDDDVHALVGYIEFANIADPVFFATIRLGVRLGGIDAASGDINPEQIQIEFEQSARERAVPQPQSTQISLGNGQSDSNFESKRR